MGTNKSRFTFQVFFSLLITVTTVGIAIFYWLGTPPQTGIETVNHTQVVMTGAIALVSLTALICLATAAYYTQPKVQWNF